MTRIKQRLCLLLLRYAAHRWHDNGQMLAEWTAELSAMDNGQLRYALSLATSRPDRVRTGRTIPAIVTSFLFLFTFPALVALWQPWMAAGGAIVLGIACARVTTGLTNVIRPSLLSTWVFGVPFLYFASLAWPEGIGWNILYLIGWAVAGSVCGIAVVRLTQRGRTALAWAVVAIAPAVIFVLSGLDGFLGFFDGTLQVPRSEVVDVIVRLIAHPFLHLTLFGLVYTRGLATRIPGDVPAKALFSQA